MVNDREGRVTARTVSGIIGISTSQFVTREIGWMIQSLSLYETTDAGISWLRLRIKGNPELLVLHFSDSQNGWAAGFRGEMYHTTDGGLNWQKQDTGIDREFVEIFFVDANNGWALGQKQIDNLESRSTFIRTTDGGTTWEVLSDVDQKSTDDVAEFYFVNAMEGWAIDSLNKITHTVDGGKTWTVQRDRDDEGNLISLYFLSGTEGWACGNGILHTSDGGAHWEYQLQTDGVAPNYFEKVLFVDSKHGWAISPERAIRTTDGGRTWRDIPEDWKKSIGSLDDLRLEDKSKAQSLTR